MNKFRNRIVAGSIAIGLGLASITALAQGGGCHHKGAGHASYGQHDRSPEKIKAHLEKRQTELLDKLKLSANQETAWKTYIGKLGPVEHRRPDRAEIDKLSAPERMEKMLGFMQERQDQLAKRAAATKEFYAVLTPAQQGVFNDGFARRSGRHHHRGPF